MLDETTSPLKSLKCYKSVQLLPIFSPSPTIHFPKRLPVLQRSSTMKTCFPLGSPSATRTTRLSPSRTLLQNSTWHWAQVSITELTPSSVQHSVSFSCLQILLQPDRFNTKLRQKITGYLPLPPSTISKTRDPTLKAPFWVVFPVAKIPKIQHFQPQKLC